MDKLGRAPLFPTLRFTHRLLGRHCEAGWQGNRFGQTSRRRPTCLDHLPIQPRRRCAGVGQPIQHDVVQPLVERKRPFGVAGCPAGILEHLVDPGCLRNGRISQRITNGLWSRLLLLGIQVMLDLDNRRIDILAEGTDVIIRIGALPDSTRVARTLAAVELWLCASPTYLLAHGIPASLDDLSRYDVVERTETSIWTFGEGPDTKQIQVHVRSMIPDAGAQKVVLTGGGGIGRIPDYLAAPAVASGQVRCQDQSIVSQLSLGLFKTVFRYTGNHHTSTLSHELARRFKADAGSTAGDQNDFISKVTVQVSHGHYLSRDVGVCRYHRHGPTIQKTEIRAKPQEPGRY